MIVNPNPSLFVSDSLCRLQLSPKGSIPFFVSEARLRRPFFVSVSVDRRRLVVALCILRRCSPFTVLRLCRRASSSRSVRAVFVLRRRASSSFKR
ncbi:hypothetical protein SESBI_36578 [Sesbania bispinosa]|nr:hypothetical protein SESBI_36578 [Sesbania bispinosa]